MAVSETLDYRAVDAELMRPSWIVFAAMKSWLFLFVDASEGGATSNVFFHLDGGPIFGSNSLGQLIETWADRIERGEVTYLPDAGRWDAKDPLLPECVDPAELDFTGLDFG